jgi:DNA adenine methylase
MRFLSPLRYPGGKRKLAEFMTDVVILNNIQDGVYIEPFAGGASIALHLLFRNYVRQIHINDIDRSVYSVWYAILNHTEEFCKNIYETQVDINTWEKQKKIQKNKENVDLLELGFSTFFLNRTNRSGIINGGIIGGKNQNGKWKIDERFNKNDLILRIKEIAYHRDKMFIYCQDAKLFLKNIVKKVKEPALIYLDPPYYLKGSSLYFNHYAHNDHLELSRLIKKIKNRWILTYDFIPEIKEMYKDVRTKNLALNYSASKKIMGHEILAYSNNLIFPEATYPSICIE